MNSIKDLGLMIHTHDPFIMHSICKFFPTNSIVINSILQLHPNSIKLPLEKMLIDRSEKLVKHRGEESRGTYPLHICLSNNASLDVVNLLINADPSILRLIDSNGSTPLHIALKNKCSFEIISKLLSADRSCVEILDNRHNLPLHIAVTSGCIYKVVKLVLSNYSIAINKRNRDGKTPFDLAVTYRLCNEKVLDLLHESLSDEVPDILQL